MAEISNRTIALLLVATIVISLGGAMVSISKLQKYRDGMTGFAGTNLTRGNLSLTIQDLTWINFSTRTCNFGSGYVLKDTCWINTTTVNTTSCSSTFAACNNLLAIKNIGNNNVTLNISWTNNSAFLQSSGGSLQFKIINGTAVAGTGGGCSRITGGLSTFHNTWQVVTVAGQHNITCDRFTYTVGRNTISMALKVGFTQAAYPGFKQNIIRAYGKTKLG